MTTLPASLAQLIEATNRMAAVVQQRHEARIQLENQRLATERAESAELAALIRALTSVASSLPTAQGGAQPQVGAAESPRADVTTATADFVTPHATPFAASGGASARTVPLAHNEERARVTVVSPTSPASPPAAPLLRALIEAGAGEDDDSEAPSEATSRESTPRARVTTRASGAVTVSAPKSTGVAALTNSLTLRTLDLPDTGERDGHDSGSGTRIQATYNLGRKLLTAEDLLSTTGLSDWCKRIDELRAQLGPKHTFEFAIAPKVVPILRTYHAGARQIIDRFMQDNPVSDGQPAVQLDWKTIEAIHSHIKDDLLKDDVPAAMAAALGVSKTSWEGRGKWRGLQRLHLKGEEAILYSPAFMAAIERQRLPVMQLLGKYSAETLRKYRMGSAFRTRLPYEVAECIADLLPQRRPQLADVLCAITDWVADPKTRTTVAMIGDGMARASRAAATASSPGKGRGKPAMAAAGVTSGGDTPVFKFNRDTTEMCSKGKHCHFVHWERGCRFNHADDDVRAFAAGANSKSKSKSQSESRKGDGKGKDKGKGSHSKSDYRLGAAGAAVNGAGTNAAADSSAGATPKGSADA